jgi:hypothetical protein
MTAALQFNTLTQVLRRFAGDGFAGRMGQVAVPCSMKQCITSSFLPGTDVFLRLPKLVSVSLLAASARLFSLHPTLGRARTWRTSRSRLVHTSHVTRVPGCAGVPYVKFTGCVRLFPVCSHPPHGGTSVAPASVRALPARLRQENQRCVGTF